MDIPHILDNGKDIAFYCARLEGKTTLTACEELCPRHSSCDTVAMAKICVLVGMIGLYMM